MKIPKGNLSLEWFSQDDSKRGQGGNTASIGLSWEEVKEGGALKKLHEWLIEMIEEKYK